MTREQVDSLKWVLSSTLAMTDRHVICYRAKDYYHIISETVTKKDKYGNFKKGKTYYYIGNKEYSDKVSFYEAMESINYQPQIGLKQK